MVRNWVHSTHSTPYGDVGSKLKEIPMRVVCTESAESWHVSGLSFNFTVDQDGYHSEESTGSSTRSPRVLMNGGKLRQMPIFRLGGFTSEESADNLPDSPSFVMDGGMMKQMLAGGLGGAKGTGTLTCSPGFATDVDMAQQKHFIQLAESVCKVRDLVLCTCGFLRIYASTIYIDTNEKCKRRGSVALLRIHVQHLPFRKRAKWRLPLFLAISGLLQKNGCASKVQGNELFAPLVHGALARIDFEASDDKAVDALLAEQM